MAKTIPFTEARAHLSDLVDEVERRHEHVVITRNGRPAAVVLSAGEYEELEETLEILQDEDTLAALRESERDVQAGRLFTLDAVRRELGLA
ncbi:MAG TPA: type II toxin-antitoxin system Phd/YefM family antitoxin [Solirubrobacteraceae bacterium]|nr:type II toxin-antitoxin system Phd/YefM family antitoxin [Solirubrobacteraceae bacterium]